MRLVKHWDKLLKEFEEFSSLEIFKTQLDSLNELAHSLAPEQLALVDTTWSGGEVMS